MCSPDTMTVRPAAEQMTQHKLRIHSEMTITKAEFHTLAHYQRPTGAESFDATKKCWLLLQPERHFPTVVTSGLFCHSSIPQETAARDSVLHPHMVATWNPTGGAVKHMDMWPQVHMAPNEGVTIYRLTSKIQQQHLRCL